LSSLPRRWAPVLLWAALILILTSYPNPPVPAIARFAGADKIVHFSLYLVLALLAVRAAVPGRGRRRVALVVAATVSLIAAGDELHQRLIPGRSAERADWIADSLGGSVGAVAAIVTLRRRDPAS
jgi:VanZ family protein